METGTGENGNRTERKRALSGGGRRDHGTHREKETLPEWMEERRVKMDSKKGMGSEDTTP